MACRYCYKLGFISARITKVLLENCKRVNKNRQLGMVLVWLALSDISQTFSINDLRYARDMAGNSIEDCQSGDSVVN